MAAMIDKILDRITAEQAMIWYTGGLLVIALIFGLFGFADIDATTLGFSFLMIAATCWLTNEGLSRLLRIPVHAPSNLITSFILTLAMTPVSAHSRVGVAGLVVAAFVATASKFLIAIRRRHIVNPAAFGLLAAAIVVDQPATWWFAATIQLLPFVVLGGLLVAYKTRRFAMIGAYVAANLIVTLITASPYRMISGLSDAILYGPLLFVGFALLTDPMTSPVHRHLQIAFAVVVGLASSTNLHIGDIYATPEFALVLANVAAFALEPKRRHRLRLKGIERTAENCYDFVFDADETFRFRAGQHADWSLAVASPEARDTRRTLTIASAPGETDLRLGLTFRDRPSAYERALISLQPGDTIFASHPAGDFTLPSDADEKLAFLAAGIGITPFRSMVQQMLIEADRRSVVLIYGTGTVSEVAYSDVIERAVDDLALRAIYAIADGVVEGANVHRGQIDRELIKREIPDYDERTFYLSGPRAIVHRLIGALQSLGVARRRIKVDACAGFAY